jgi:hypothetical protein
MQKKGRSLFDLLVPVGRDDEQALQQLVVLRQAANWRQRRQLDLVRRGRQLLPPGDEARAQHQTHHLCAEQQRWQYLKSDDEMN